MPKIRINQFFVHACYKPRTGRAKLEAWSVTNEVLASMKVVVFASSLFLLLLAGDASSSPDYKLISSKQWPRHKVLRAEPLAAESTETKYIVRFVKNQKIANAIDVAVIKTAIKKRTSPDGNVLCGPFQVSYLGKCRDILSPKYKLLVNTNSASNQ